MEAITVGLYGQGTRNSRLRAEYVYCDRFGGCDAYKSGSCFGVTSIFGKRCPFASVQTFDGCTKQSKTYYKVYNSAKEHDKYAALKYPSGRFITRIGNGAFVTLDFVWVETVNGRLRVSDPHFGGQGAFVEELTEDDIYRALAFRPSAIMGGEITDYQSKTVPLFIYQVKKQFPEVWEAFAEKYPDYVEKKTNFVGCKAKLITCNRDAEYPWLDNGVFHFEGDELVCDNYPVLFCPFGAKTASVRVKVTPDMEYRIKNNDQVTPETEFV